MSSKAIDIYYYSPSPPARAVLMLMKALGLEHNIKITNVVIGESKKPEFIKVIFLNYLQFDLFNLSNLLNIDESPAYYSSDYRQRLALI